MQSEVVTPAEEIGSMEATLNEAIDSQFPEEPEKATPEVTPSDDAEAEKPPVTDDSEGKPKTDETKTPEEPPKVDEPPKPEEGEGKFFYVTNKKGEKRKISEKEFMEREAEVTRNQQSRAEAERSLQQSRQFLTILEKGNPEIYAQLKALATGDPEAIKKLSPEAQVEILRAQDVQKQYDAQDQAAMRERIATVQKEITTEWDTLSKDESNYPGMAAQENEIFTLMHERLKAGVLTTPKEAYLLLNSDSIQAKHTAAIEAAKNEVRTEMEAQISAKVEEAIKARDLEDHDKRKGTVPGPGGGTPGKPETKYPEGADLDDEIAADIESGDFKLFEPT